MKSKLNFLGLELNSYYFQGYIGSGGVSDVYLVDSTKYNRQFAAKVIEASNEEILNSYKQEIKALCLLDHPNIIQLFDHFFWNNFMIMILEYCKNGSLYYEMKLNHNIHPEKLIWILTSLIKALRYTHLSGISHGDIKPLNILIDSFGRPKLSDFGLSFLDSKKENLGSIRGSLGYLSPEILMKKQYDPFKADIWALGISIYQLLTGNLPYDGKNSEELLKNILTKRLILTNEIPNYFAVIIQKTLQIDPDNRINIHVLNELITDITCQNNFKTSINLNKSIKKVKIAGSFSYGLLNTIKHKNPLQKAFSLGDVDKL